MSPSRRSQVPPFEVMRILDRVAELRAAGRDVVSLCAGEPSGGAPVAVHERAQRLHAARHALGYTPALGTLELREALASHCARWYGLDVDPRSVAITTGSSGAFLLAFLSAFEHGDRVALARPGYPAYRNILRSLGCEVVELDCGPEVRFQPTPELLDAAVADGGPIAGLVVASPANPTGTMIGRDELAALSHWCRRRGARLVSDEIYHGIAYPDDPSAPGARGTSAWELDRDAIVVSSFSKYWGMTGFRLGWMLVPDDLRAPADALAGNLALCPPAPAQLAALGAFEEESYAEAERRVREFAASRALLLARLSALGWGTIAPADGAFYVYADIAPRLGPFPDSSAWCAALLEEEGVAVVPGADFDAVGGRTFIRLSLAAGPAAVDEALTRIARFQTRRA
ncbi:aminotransferase class I/II-fold pyridoxal phosphate-dependent enzyme [Microbacterium sp. Marseille-Q6965]|uniref:aminotransferase class I/II-fold pyridoxal phosphate-dependent enzyme n=1 Tax=Microbacterium sp. Marseille-Q6965 TaxID=2965072 RepID=UPI0021B726C6|nr:aminotransferase class I/II-fold pyridoxal phosphate-dependent enzyme [Microbacterium sp. Marseille-Q6965]